MVVKQQITFIDNKFETSYQLLENWKINYTKEEWKHSLFQDDSFFLSCKIDTLFNQIMHL